VGGTAVSRPLQCRLDCGMLFNARSTLRRRFALAALNFSSRVAFLSSQRPSARVAQNESVTTILVLELWNIGDLILATPFLAQLRALFPQARITLVARPFAPELLAGSGLVDEFIATGFSWIPAAHLRLSGKLIDLWRLSRKLHLLKFDLAFSSRLHIGEHFVLSLSRAKRRVGFSLGARNEALTDVIPAEDIRQQRVDDWMQLLAPFGGPVVAPSSLLHVDESERERSKGYLASLGVRENDVLVGIHPGASLTEKRWPLERFREVATAIVAQPGVRVLCFAEPSGYGSDLFAIPGVIGAQVGLRELMALIERCSVLVCNDSGPMHIAGALGVPTVAMFGSGIEQWFAPLGDGHEALRPERDNPLLTSELGRQRVREPRGIEASHVLDAVARVLHRVGGRRTL
jgi:heptosyltransferase-2